MLVKINRLVTQAVQIPGLRPRSESRVRRREGNLWQRRFWEHLIRDAQDFERQFVKFENIYTSLKEYLFSDGFAACARIALTDFEFTRERVLPLPAVVVLLLNLRTGTIQDELDQFIDLFAEGLSSHGVSASAFCQARQKLNPRAVMKLSDHLAVTF